MSTDIHARALELLGQVQDPELGADIVSLGLVLDVEVQGRSVAARMTTTSPACPVGPLMRSQAERALRSGLPGFEVSVALERPGRASEVEEGGSPPLRALLMLPAGIALLTGLATGLSRVGLVPTGSLATLHGPLMVCGFLGTLISLERAVALGTREAYAAPLLSGIGALAFLAGLPALGAAASTAGAAGLLAIFAVLLGRQPSVHLGLMTAGAACWLIGDLAWLAGVGIWTVAWWWAAFLVLTIVGERLELGEMDQTSPRSRPLLGGLGIALVGGVTALQLGLGGVVLGVVLFALALWLMTQDVALRTVRRAGLTRYVAVCLLGGFAWLGVTGVLVVAHGPEVAGPIYDAQLHALFVGFVFAMIFGHAPVVLPAVLELPLRYRPALYVPLGVLHLALLARVVGDLAGPWELRQGGTAGTAAAVVLFAALQLHGVLTGPGHAETRPSPAR